MVLFQAEGGYFRGSQRNAQLHKNIFFCLMYFHAIVTNRKHYGIIGWNIPYQFAFSDFEVSAAQLAEAMGH